MMTIIFHVNIRSTDKGILLGSLEGKRKRKQLRRDNRQPVNTMLTKTRGLRAKFCQKIKQIPRLCLMLKKYVNFFADNEMMCFAGNVFGFLIYIQDQRAGHFKSSSEGFNRYIVSLFAFNQNKTSRNILVS